MDLKPRPIKNDIPVVNNRPENEKPSRWTFSKVLREYSSLKELKQDADAEFTRRYEKHHKKH